MSEELSERQQAMLDAMRYIDAKAGEINGVPNEPGEPISDPDIIASDLADAFGVEFDEHWPSGVASAALATPRPAGARAIVEAGERLLAFARGGPMTWRQGGPLGEITDYNALRADILAALSATLSPQAGGGEYQRGAAAMRKAMADALRDHLSPRAAAIANGVEVPASPPAPAENAGLMEAADWVNSIEGVKPADQFIALDRRLLEDCLARQAAALRANGAEREGQS